MSEITIANGRLITLTIIILVGLLIIYIYHECLKPSYDRALVQHERVHKIAELYKQKKSSGEKIPDYNIDDLKQSLIKVKNILIHELLLKPNDTTLNVALSNIEEDLEFVNPPIEQQLPGQA
jgi:hypothetical protein